MNILLTCAGRRNYMVEYFKSAVAPYGGLVFAANSHAHSTALMAAHRGFVVPELDHPEYLDAILDICEKHDVQAVLSLFDLELPVLARAKPILESRGIQVVVSSESVIEICNDKWRTASFLSDHSFDGPRTFLGLDHAQSALHARRAAFPMIIKPRWGMGSIGVVEVEDMDELQVMYRKVERLIEKSYLRRLCAEEDGGNVLIQQKVSGIEYGLDVVNDLEGDHVATFVKRKIEMRSGETEAATTEDSSTLRALGERLGRRLRHVANLDVDVIVDDDGAHVLDMNARFGGHYPFSQLAGADVPAAIVAWLRRTPVDPAWLQVAGGVTGYKGFAIIPEPT